MKNRTERITGFLWAVILIAAVAWPPPTAAATSPPTERPRYVEGELLVKFKEDVSRGQRDRLLQLGDMRKVEIFGKNRIERIKLERMSVEQGIERLRKSPLVEYVEPNYLRWPVRDTSDPLFPYQWGLKNQGQYNPGTACLVGYDAGIDRAWNLETGSSDVLVAVIDTGIDLTHPDLQANLWINPGEIPGNGLDDGDPGTYVDDVNGWDFVQGDNDPSHTASSTAHGTNVAGVIGATAHNETGVAGVAWNVSILPLRAGSPNFGTPAVVGAIEYAVEQGADVINMSFGGNDLSQSELDALEAASAAGVILVAASGNDGSNNDVIPFYPASYDVDNLVTVGASFCYGGLVGYSNYGPLSVEIAAPGHNIHTTSWDPSSGSGYTLQAGTSFAAPMVSGAIAILKSAYPGDTPTQIVDRLLQGARYDAALDGLIAGGRHLDLFNTMAQEETVPPSGVSDLVATATPDGVLLSWTAPGDDGSVGRAGVYDVRRSSAPIDAGNFDAAEATLWPPFPSDAGTAETFDVGGLDYLATYYFALKTADEWERPENTSTISNVVQVTTLGPPALLVETSSVDESGDKGSTVPSTITISNTGASTLEYDVTVASGNFLSVGANGSGTIAPGASVNVDVSLAALACGLQTGSFLVDSPNAGSQVTVPASITVGGPAEVKVLPYEYMDFGLVRIDEIEYDVLSIENSGCEMLAILGMNSPDPNFVLKNKVLSVPAESTRWVLVEFTPTELGPDRSDILMQTSDDDEQWITVIAVANVVTPQELDFSPGSFDVLIPTGGAATQTLTIDNLGGNNLNYWIQNHTGVSWLTIDDDLGTIPGYGQKQIALEFTADGQCAATDSVDLRLLTDDDDEGETFLPVTWEVYAAPDVTVTQGSAEIQPGAVINFNNPVQNKSIVFTNDGCQPLTIQDISTGRTPAFSVSFNGPVTVAPGDSYTQQITFLGCRQGGLQQCGTPLTVTTDDPDESSLVYSLFGTGYAP